MKLKISMLAGALLLAHSSFGQITDPSPYCKAGYDDLPDSWPHYISNVTLGSLNNTSGDTQFAAPHYVYYNNVTAPDLIAGHTYSISISHDDNGLHFLAVYIDYDHNNNFYDSGERVLQQKDVWGTMSITNPAVATITIPTTATAGITRMRVMAFEDDYYTMRDSNATPCTNDSLEWGETEDYNVNIIPSTGITEIAQNNMDIFYPNPANNSIYVDKSLLSSQMTIYDMKGKIILRGAISNQKIDVSNIAPGQYIIRVVSKDNVYTQRLTILRQ